MAFRITLDGQPHEVEIVRRRPHLVVRIDGREHEISRAGELGDGRREIEVAGQAVPFLRARSGEYQIIRLGGRTFEISLADSRSAAEGSAGQDQIRAPMPGAVVSMERQVGDLVKRGETIVTIESMKLQTALTAPRDGKIAELLRAAGERFEKDDVLARLEEAGGAA